jgi:hypothetical protein
MLFSDLLEEYLQLLAILESHLATSRLTVRDFLPKYDILVMLEQKHTNTLSS